MVEFLQDLSPAQIVAAAVSTFVLLSVLFALLQGWTWDRARQTPEPWYSDDRDPPFPDDPPETLDSHLYEHRRN